MSDAHEPNPPPPAIPVDMPTPPSPGAEPETLPYAGFSSSSIGIWRRGKLLVMREGLQLPAERCVVCGEQAEGRPLKRHLSWHHPSLYALLPLGLLIPFLGFLIYVIVALIVRKTAIIFVGLCPVHRKRRRSIIAMCWFIIFTGVVIIWISFQIHDPNIAWLAALSFFGGWVVHLMGAQVVTAYRIDKYNVWIRGAGQAYLDALPLYPGP